MKQTVWVVMIRISRREDYSFAGVFASEDEAHTAIRDVFGDSVVRSADERGYAWIDTKFNDDSHDIAVSEYGLGNLRGLYEDRDYKDYVQSKE